MYRHFAILTVAMTALLAFFANGENQKAVAAASASEQPATPKAPVSKRIEVETETAETGSWGSDDSDGLGQPTMGSGAGVGAWASNPFGLARDHRSPTDSDKTLLRREDGDEAETDEAPEAPTAAQIAAAAAASRLRSGARGND